MSLSKLRVSGHDARGDYDNQHDFDHCMPCAGKDARSGTAHSSLVGTLRNRNRKPKLRTAEALCEWREGGRERAAPPSAAPGQRRLLHALGLHPGQPCRFASTRHCPPPRRQVALTLPHPRQLYSSERAPSGSAGACARGQGRRVGRLLQVPLPLVFGPRALPSACPRLRSAHESAILTAHRFVWICGRNDGEG